MTEPPIRYARIARRPAEPGDVEQIRAYLPANYQIASVEEDAVIVVGRDDAGWTLDGYVLPRLASGLRFGREITAEEVAS